MLNEGVLQGIRGMLPVKSILREYLKEDAEEEEEEAEGEADANLEDIVESTRGGKSEASEGPSEKVEKAVEKAVEKTVEKPAEKVVEKPSEMVFTGNDTLLNKERNIPIVAEMEQDSIKIIDEPPAAMDEFEDIEPKDSILPMDFEELM